MKKGFDGSYRQNNNWRGGKGYNALFSSRFNKLKRIVSDRPESRMLKSINSVKTAKSEDDMYVCGLVTTRNSERETSQNWF